MALREAHAINLHTRSFLVAKTLASDVMCSPQNKLSSIAPEIGFASLLESLIIDEVEANQDGEFFKVLTSVIGDVEISRETQSAQAQWQRRAAALLHGRDVKIKLWEERDR
jgi:hypothetical protein